MSTTKNEQLQEFMNMPNVWDFVEKYYPNYYSSDRIALSNDLAKLVHEEYEEGDCAHRLLMRDYGGDIDNPQIKIDNDAVEREVIDAAILEFLHSKKEQSVTRYYLFGKDVSEKYKAEGFEKAFSAAKDVSEKGLRWNSGMNFDVHKFVDGENPEHLIEAYEGYDGFVEITADEYEQLNNLD
jgi:hypothetical protein